jgi:phage/plasmid-associated DNA primase
VDKTDEAMFARIAPINFPHTFVAGIDETPNLEKLIIEDSAGFLEWLKWGYLTYLEEGLDKTDSMEALKRGERETDSSAFQYIDALLESNTLHFDPEIPKSHSVSLKELHENYVTYCTNHAVKHSEVLTQREFSKHLQIRYVVANTGGYRVEGLKYASELVRKN